MSMIKRDIVRRVMSTGELIGPYARVLSAKGNIKLIKTEDGITYRVPIECESFYKRLRIQTVLLNSQIIDRITSGKTDSVIHDMDMIWSKFLDNIPDVVEIIDTISRDRYVYTVLKADLLYIDRKKCVRLYFGKRLML